MARPRSPLTTFILSLPTALPAKEVISRAKAKGMATTEQNVSRVRKLSGGKATKSVTAKKVGMKSKAPTAKAMGVSKSEFIRQQPATASPHEVVASAKAAGIKFDHKYVYRIRALAQGKGARKKPAAAPQRVQHPTTAHPSALHPTRSNGAGNTSTSKVEALLHAIAAELGLGRALALLTEERARVTSLLGR
jgi:hypothetical protein